jgi:hypothetical protein
VFRRVFAVTVAVLVIAAPASADTVAHPQQVGDEFLHGHDITKLRLSNTTGAVTVKMWVGRLHRSNNISLDFETRDVSDYNYLAAGEFVNGAPTGYVRTWNLGTPPDTVTCAPRVRFDFGHDTITLRAQDACFPGSDLSKVLIAACLGVRGHNNCADYTGNYVVRRD